MKAEWSHHLKRVVVVLEVAEKTAAAQDIGAPIAAADPDAGGTVTYTLGNTTDDGHFAIVADSGQLQTKEALDFEGGTTSYTVTVTASDGALSASIAITITVTDVNEAPVFLSKATVDQDGNEVAPAPISAAARAVAENTDAGQNIGDPVAATDPDAGAALTYTLGNTTDDGHFAIVADSGQLQTKEALDFEGGTTSYTVTVTASDGALSASIAITITVTDVNEAPVFLSKATVDQDGNEVAPAPISAAARAVAENTDAGQDIGAPVAATDPDAGAALTYALAASSDPGAGSDDHTHFAIVADSGQLQTRGALDHEDDDSYIVVVTVSDGKNAAGEDDDTVDARITITITVGDEDEDPAAPTGVGVTAAVASLKVAWTAPTANAMAGLPALTGYQVQYRRRTATTPQDTWTGWQNHPHVGTATAATIGSLTATETYQVQVRSVNHEGESGWVAAAATGVPTWGNRAPVFPSDTDITLEVDENTAPGADIGDSPTATDPDGDSLTYTLGGTDSGHFAIVAGSGQLQTKGALDHENQDSYSVVVTASDGTLADTIAVTINVNDLNEAPGFDGGLAASVNAAENQTAVATPEVTDPEGDTLTYRLDPAASFTDSGVSNDHASFTMTTAGVLTFNEAPDFEAAKNAYTLVIEVRDSKDGAGRADTDWDDAITLTVNVTDADEPPGAPTVVQVTSTANGLDVAWTAPVMTGKPPLSGYDVERRLRSSAADAVSETWGTWTDVSHGDTSTSADITGLTPGATYQVRVRGVNAEGDGEWAGPEDGVPGQPNRAPAFLSDSVTLEVDENTAPGADIGGSPTATDPDGDSLVYTLGGTDSGHFAIVAGSGQLQTKGALDHENQDSYSVVVTASDGTLADTIAVTINVNDLNEAPGFDGGSATVEVAENTASGANIDQPVTAVDPDGDTLTYTLGGADAGHFAIAAKSGQLQTKGALDHESDDTYKVTVTATDPDGLNASITVTITVTDLNEPPGAPGDLAVTPVESGLDVTWTAPVMTGKPPLTGYDVERRLRSSAADAVSETWGTWTDVSHGDTSTSADITGLTPGATYQVRVRGVNAEGDGEWAGPEDGVPGQPNRAPAFLSDSVTLEVDENTAPGADIGGSPTATDPDGDSLVYTLGGTDSGHFAIVAGSGQLQTKGALDHENQDSYSVVVTASDGTLADTIAVTINVNDLNEAPGFDGGSATVEVAENTASGANIDQPVTAVDPDGDTLTYTLGGTDSGHFDIAAKSGQLQTKGALDHESDDTYKVTVTATDPDGLNASIAVTITVTDLNEPPGAPGDLAVTPVESGLDVTWTAPVMTGKPPLTGYDVERRLRSSAADAVSETWGTWTDVSHGDTSTSADITGLTPGATYQVRVRGVNAEGDGEWAGPENGVPGQPNRAPAFPSDSVTLDVDENTAPGADIDDSPTATDPDGDSLTYTLGGTDSGHFAIVAGSGQLQTKGALDHENRDSYSVVVTASDGTLADTIAVTINVNDLNEAPSFDGGLSATVEVAENTASGANIDQPVTAVDPDGDTLTYTLGGTDSGHFDIAAKSGQLQTKGALDHESDDTYKVTVTATDPDGLNASIAVTITVTDLNEPPGAPGDLAVTPVESGLDVTWTAPVMTGKPPLTGYDVERRLRSSAADAVSETWGTWTDVSHGDTSTSADITGLTPGATYQVRVRGVNAEGDGEWAGPENGVPGQPNRAPTFLSDSVTLDVDENTAPGADIGDSPTATDPDGDSLTYTLGGTDSGHFAIVAGSGQLQTKGALNHENQDSYSVVVTASDGTLSDTIAVTINVNDLNEAPSFDDGLTASVNAAENQTAVATPEVTDPEGDTLTYRLDTAATFTDPAVSNDHASFTMTTAGALTFNVAPDFEAAKNAYTLVIEVRDSRDAAGKDDTDWDDSITLTVNVTDADEPPGAPTGVEVTSTANGLDVAWTAPVMTGKPPLSGYDVERRLRSSAADAVSETWGTWTDVSHGDTSTSASLDELTPGATYQVRVRGVNAEGDGEWAGPENGVPGQPNRAPAFPSDSVTLEVDENTAPGADIDDSPTATDPDGDSLVYTLGGTDSGHFAIVAGSGQLQTKGALNHENQDSYSVVVTASDGTLADTIAVTINVNDLNEAPSFDGSGVTLEVDENTAPATAFDSPVTATDPDGDTLEYSLAGTDSGHFAIVAGSGQLKTKGALDHENQDSYAVTVTAEDPSGLSADIAVTINVTDVNEPPSFADSAKTLDVAENTAPATAIGNPIAAIDPEGDLLTYTIDGADASHFDIVARTGQLKTNGVLNLPTRRTRKAAPDGATTDSYSVVVSVSDGKDANGDADDTLDDTIDVTVRVRGVRQASAMVDYDIDDDGLIELANLARLNAIRWDLNGDGAVDNSADQPSHDAAFPNAMPGMGCPDTDGDAATPNCTGYELTENLDFDTDGSGDANSADTYWNGGQGWEPIASGANPFTAPLEGNGHTISNLFIHRTTAGGQLGEHEVGLFAHIGQINDLTAMEIDNGHNAVIRRLGLINVSVTGGGGATGALLGHNAGGKIIACYSTGSVSGGPGLAGGLVGLNNMAGLVKDSYSSADVRALHYAGGLVGDNHRGGYILTSYATGDVKANNAGGLTSGNRGHIKNTYATGDVQARLAGGLVGRNFWKIWNSYSTGAVTGVSRGPIMIGGLVGYGRTYTDPTRTLSVTPTVHDSYWDTAASGQNTSGWGGQGGAGKTAAELQTPTTFTGIYENWDDYHYLLDRGDSAMAWDLGDSSEYPALKADWDGDGEATVAEFGSQVRSARIARRSVGAEPVHQPPANLQVELQSDGSALVSWDTPDGAGGDASYSVRRRADAPNSEYVVVRVEDGDDDGAAEYLDQDSLEPGQSYLYSVRAFDGYGEPLGQWTDDVSVSIPAASPTSAANNPPSFPAASATVEVAENTASGTDIGDALTTTDPDADDKLTYTLDGKDSGHFAIDAGSGQLKTSGALDYESKDSYAVTVTATDGGGLSASIDVTITVTDVADTPPGQPDTPEIINVAETSFRVTWAAPAAGSSAITGYGIQYKLASEEDSAYADVNPTPTGTATGYNVVNRGGQTVAAGTSYAVRVRARNAEGWGLWSDAASVVTAGAPPANNPPSFAAASATVEVAENSAADTAIANSPTATDPDVGDTLTYTLGTTMDDGHFAIDTGSGQLRTKGDLDYESKDSYAVTVTATDGGGLSASVEVTITVTDVADTPPGQPATPEIINVEETSFRVTWTVPADGSSTITGYGIQYKLASEEDSAYADVNPTPTGTATGYNLVNGGGQTVAEGTSYAVRVRAKNAEGWGTWSDAASAVTAGAAPSDAAPANGDEAEADDSGDEEPADGDGSYQAEAFFAQGRVAVRWDDVDGAEYYIVEKNGQLLPGRYAATTFYDADVEGGARYEYRITAYDGEGSVLAVITATTE